MKRILVRMTGRHYPGAKLGDFLMATPALTGLRRAHPDMKITLLMHLHKPKVWFEDGLLFDDILWDDSRKKGAQIAGSYRLLRQIRERHFDAFVAFRSRSSFAWICRLANIPTRIGNTGKYHRVLYTENVTQNRDIPDRHEVEYNYDLMRPLGVSGMPGAMYFPVSSEDEAGANQLLRSVSLTETQPYLVLNPTHGGSSRCWSPDSFAQVARQLLRETALPILLIGGTQDTAKSARLAQNVGRGIHDFTGKTSAGELASLLRHSALHLSIDTGTMHLAAAMQTPCVTIFPFFEHWDQRVCWRPWQTQYRLVGPNQRCSDCVPGKCTRTQTVCMDSIQPKAVVAAAWELLNSTKISMP